MPDYEHISVKELASYRIKRAREDLKTANELLKTGDLRAANNGAYYSIFHALRSVLALVQYDSKKHSGIIAEFRRRYIKEGIFPKEMSDMIDDASIIRNASDYDDMFIASRKQTELQVENAGKILKMVEEYLSLHI